MREDVSDNSVVVRYGDGEYTYPVIDSIVPLAAIAEAHRRVESNATCGKVVLDIAPE